MPGSCPYEVVVVPRMTEELDLHVVRHPAQSPVRPSKDGVVSGEIDIGAREVIIEDARHIRR